MTTLSSASLDTRLSVIDLDPHFATANRWPAGRYTAGPVGNSQHPLHERVRSLATSVPNPPRPRNKSQQVLSVTSSRPNPKSASALLFHEQISPGVDDGECSVGCVFETLEEVAVGDRGI